MKRLLVALLLLASTASARTYWVSPTTDATAPGNDAYDGTDTTSTGPVHGPTTLTWFNANAEPGDLCRFKSGSYGAEEINPTNRNTTSSSRIRYYGFPQDPQGVRVANVQIGETAGRWGSYITVRWVKTTSAFTGVQGNLLGDVRPTGDSLVACWSSVANSVEFHGDNLVADSLVLSGTYAENLPGSQPTAISFGGSHRQTYCVVDWRREATNLRLTNSTITYVKDGVDGGFQMVHGGAQDSTVISGNTFNLTLTASPGYVFGVGLYSCRYSDISNNTWNITTSGATLGGSQGFWMLRDYSTGNRFRGNTVRVTGTSEYSGMPSNGGSCSGSTGGNYFGFNTIYVEKVKSDRGLLYFQNGTQQDTVEFNSVATGSYRPLITLYPGTANTGTVIRHNSFLTGGPTAVDMRGGTLSPLVSTRLASNVYYALQAPTQYRPTVAVPNMVQLDSAGVFFALGAASPGYAIRYGVTADTLDGVSGSPGSGTWFGGVRSAWCSPEYADSSYGTFDGRVSGSGCAAGSLWRDGYAGIGKFGGDVEDPVVVITAPVDTTYRWSTYETMALAWSRTDNVGVSSQSIEWGYGFSPSAWNVIASGFAGSASTYNWVLPAFNQTYVTVRVTAYDAAGGTGRDTQVFVFNAREATRDTQLDAP